MGDPMGGAGVQREVKIGGKTPGKEVDASEVEEGRILGSVVRTVSGPAFKGLYFFLRDA